MSWVNEQRFIYDNETIDGKLVVDQKGEDDYEYSMYWRFSEGEDLSLYKQVRSPIYIEMPKNYRSEYMSLIVLIAEELPPLLRGEQAPLVTIQHGTEGRAKVEDLLYRLTINKKYTFQDLRKYFLLTN